MFGVVQRQEWVVHGKCVGDDPTRYEVENLNPFDRDRDAKRLCAGCPVAGQCLADARKSFSMSVFTGVYEPDARLRTSGVVRGGRVFV